MLLVSHDRAFLNDVVTSTLAIEADGQVKEYDGGYDDYLRQRPAEIAPKPQVSDGCRHDPVAVAKPRQAELQGAEELESLPARIESLERRSAIYTRRWLTPRFIDATAAQSWSPKLSWGSWSATWRRPMTAGSRWRPLAG